MRGGLMRLYSRFTLTVILAAGFGANAQDVAFGYQQGSKGNGPCNSRLQRSPVPFVCVLYNERETQKAFTSGRKATLNTACVPGLNVLSVVFRRVRDFLAYVSWRGFLRGQMSNCD